MHKTQKHQTAQPDAFAINNLLNSTITSIENQGSLPENDRCHQPTNQEFLTAVFGADAPFAHVCGFPDDPSNIAQNRRAKCWGGTQAQHTSLSPDQNNYYTISTFLLAKEGAP